LWAQHASGCLLLLLIVLTIVLLLSNRTLNLFPTISSYIKWWFTKLFHTFLSISTDGQSGQHIIFVIIIQIHKCCRSHFVQSHRLVSLKQLVFHLDARFVKLFSLLYLCHYCHMKFSKYTLLLSNFFLDLFDYYTSYHFFYSDYYI
jgi:hypothetical protein